MDTKEIIVRVAELEKSYRLEKVVVPVLRNVSFEIERGSWTALLGASGSGKTTLLNLLGAFESPDRGEIYHKDSPYSRMGRRRLAGFRGREIGFIFQSYHLLPELSVRENVELPGRLIRRPLKELRAQAEKLLEQVGLSHRLRHRPNELSGGEQQRAAIARALINSPSLILADEPTGNLDSRTGGEILEIFKRLHDGNVSIIMVTHDRNVAALADHIIELKDGMISA